MKVSKEKANYRKATGRQNCGNCSHMNQDGSCVIVQGIVTRSMTSDYWKAK